MTGHGAESYFVIGEGLLSESAEGRERAVMAADAAQAAPPFRFSRWAPAAPRWARRTARSSPGR